MGMTNEQFFYSVFPSKVSNVEFYGSEVDGINHITCMIITPQGKFFTGDKRQNLYDAFVSAWSKMRKPMHPSTIDELTRNA